MGKDTRIEWTATRHADGTVTPGMTFNIVWGCQKVSAGCANCYAETWAHRHGHDVWGPAKTTPRRVLSDAYWKQPLAWNRAAEAAGVRARVFCSSMADVFEDHPTVETQRLRLWALIAETPWLDWLLLTKRPQYIVHMVPGDWLAPRGAFKVLPYPGGWPANVWIGTSVEDQQRADERIPALLQVPARVRFLSMEPLLGPVNLTAIRCSNGCAPPHYCGECYPDGRTATGTFDAIGDGAISWVIVGGESGGQARPMHPAWVRSLRDQCVSAGTAFFFKQWGEWHPDCLCRRPKPCREIPRPSPGGRGVMFRCGKAAGRTLDGREWNEIPDNETAPALPTPGPGR